MAGSRRNQVINCSPAVATPAPSSSARTRASCPRVLIVEDQQDTGMLMWTFLSTHGFTATYVQTVAEGLRLLEQPWDAVVTDIGLTDGSGLEICRCARARSRSIKILAVSGYGSKADVAASLDAGCNQHLVKPVDLDRVAALLA